MAETRSTGKAAGAGDGGAEPAGPCPVALCPIGAALSAAQQVRPEVIEHLLIAGRELMLVAKAVLDARLADAEEPAPTLERIEIG
jgi:hypothetical protein